MKYLKKLTIYNNHLNKIVNKINDIEIKEIDIINHKNFSLLQNKDFIIKSKVINLSYDLLLKNKNNLNEDHIKKLENIISKDSKYSYRYASEIIEGRWEEGEESISKNSQYSYMYARNIIKGCWERGEKSISKNPYYSYIYACDVIKGRWECGEKSISEDSKISYWYASDVIEGPWEPGEESISKNSSYYSYRYARNVIKGAFDKGHSIIFSSDYKNDYLNFLKSINYDITKINDSLI